MTKQIIPVPPSVRKNLTGHQFGRLTVIGYVGKENANSQWLCACECGNSTVLITSQLLRTDSPWKSCGCQSRMSAYKHGMTGTPEYQAWRSMYQRCTNPNNPQYNLYGGRGIKVCNRWRESFDNFYADMGPRPGGEYSIDRVDANGDYEPGNCRWATPAQQSNNKRDNRVIEFDGESHTLTEWATIAGLSKSGLRWRLDNGWPVGDALTVAAGPENLWRYRSHHTNSKG